MCAANSILSFGPVHWGLNRIYSESLDEGEDMQEYYLSDSQNELSRLAFQHQVWAKETVDLWQRAKFMPGDRILDLGCGPGYTTLDLAQLVGPSGKVTGVDSSEKFISYLDKTLEATATRNVETHICDISKLPFSPSCFDGIYSRMVMCFLKDPKAVLTNLVKMLKPGGKMVITDFFSYADSFFVVPESKAITKAMKGIEKGNSVLGGNFNVQRKIPSDLSDLGLDIIDTKASVRTGMSGQVWWKNNFSAKLKLMISGEIGI